MNIPHNPGKLDPAFPRVVTLRRGTRPMTPAMDRKLPEPQTIPLELGGKWIAWSADCLRIVAHGDTLGEVKEEAEKAGEQDPCFQKAPPADVRIVGIAR